MYTIEVAIRTKLSTEEIVGKLQQAYDGGAAGLFKVVRHKLLNPNTAVIVFERDICGDEEYIVEHMAKDGLSAEQAAVKQLAVELIDGTSDSFVHALAHNMKAWVLDMFVDFKGDPPKLVDNNYTVVWYTIVSAPTLAAAAHKAKEIAQHQAGMLNGFSVNVLEGMVNTEDITPTNGAGVTV